MNSTKINPNYSQPFFSVVIPTLNEEKYLPKLLGDLGRQTFCDFEVIVADGKSSDNTIQAAKKKFKDLKQKKISSKVIISKKRNVAYQRNLGAKEAKGEYLAFFDADSRLPTDFLGGVKNKAIKAKGRAKFLTTLVVPDRLRFFEQAVATSVNLMIIIGKMIAKPLAPGFNTIIKKQVFDKIGGFDTKVNIADDYELSLRARSFGYNLSVLANPKVIMSCRRFRKHGWIKTSFKYLYMIIYHLVCGPTRKNKFYYPMGGQAHE